jgi:hypothetical protein
MVHDDGLAEGVAERTYWQCLCSVLLNTLTHAEPPQAQFELFIHGLPFWDSDSSSTVDSAMPNAPGASCRYYCGPTSIQHVYHSIMLPFFSNVSVDDNDC